MVTNRRCTVWVFKPQCMSLISHASKVMLKILQAKLKQYVNCELPDVQGGFIVAEHWSRVWAPILQMRTLRLREFICNLPTVPEQ